MNVRRDPDGSVVFTSRGSSVHVGKAQLTGPNGEQTDVMLLRLVDQETGIGFETIFDEDGWQALKAQEYGIVVAGRMPQGPPPSPDGLLNRAMRRKAGRG